MKMVEGFFVPDYDDNMKDNLVASPSFAGRGTYQFYLFQRVFALCPDFRHGVDIGAHVGTWSYAMSRCFARVTAFEPVPSHVECWRRNLEETWNTELNEVALGDKVANGIMATKPPVSLKARIKTSETGPTYPVQIKRLDNFALKMVDLIKIDVEGFELFVCRGGENTIKQNRPLVVVEQKPKNVERYKIPDTAAVDLLMSWGALLRFESRGDYCLEFPR
jgi:FkbM family methyltransferase